MMPFILGGLAGIASINGITSLLTAVVTGAELLSVTKALALVTAAIWLSNAAQHARSGVSIREMFGPGVCAISGHRPDLCELERVVVTPDGQQVSTGVSRVVACRRCLVPVGD